MSVHGQFLELLNAVGPAPEHEDQLMQFGRFVGSWHLDASFWDDDGIEERTTAEWHWGWILGGSALQDVLVFPARSDDVEPAAYRLGTSLRVFDHGDAIWRVVWVAPQSGTIYKLSGRFTDDGTITLNGDPHDGEPTRWVFSDITATSFTWDGFVKEPGGGDWRLVQSMTATRS